MTQKVLLCILDGYGLYKDYDGNAVFKADNKVFNRLVEENPYNSIFAAEEYVGLPKGQMGNSEVGHMNLGVGRVAKQLLPRINDAVESGDLENIENLQSLIKTVKENTNTVHLMGLFSDGGVHSHINHLIALCEILSKNDVKVWVHAVLDGRDTAQKSAGKYFDLFEEKFAGNDLVNIATISGRYYTMDRDKNWDRQKLAYDVYTNPKIDILSTVYKNAKAALEKEYLADRTDEFVKPCVISGFDGMKDGDGFIFFNFRTDRALQITNCLCNPSFNGFERKKKVSFSYACSMVDYSEKHKEFLSSLFPPQKFTNSLGEVIANAGLRQLRIAETEKYAHVTFYFNGVEDRVFENEDRVLIQSPAVATFDQKPEMSAFEITDKLEEVLPKEKYDLVVLNYANGDMVGHTGMLDKCIIAVETVDKCLERVEKLCKDLGYTLVVTADHGNCEEEINENTGEAITAHTLNKVPFIIVEPDGVKTVNSIDDGGALCDVAPTILDLMGVDKPVEMTGKSLVK